MAPEPRPPQTPQRTCVGCRAVREQHRLVRLVADGGGGVVVNPRRAVGRGAYLCPSLSCLEEALRRNVLPRALRVELPGLDAAALRRRIAAEEEGRSEAAARGKVRPGS